MFLLGLVARFAGWLLVMWRWKRYLEMAYALYLVVLSIYGMGKLLSAIYRLCGDLLLSVVDDRRRLRG